jgi:hypothetical protein
MAAAGELGAVAGAGRGREAVRGRRAQFGVDRRWRSKAAALVHATIVAPVVLAARDAAEPRAGAEGGPEVEFAYPIPDPPLDRSGELLAGGLSGPRGFVKGFIDAIVAWDDRWFVIDYKSDVLDDDPRALKAHVDEHYRVQASCTRWRRRRCWGWRASRIAGAVRRALVLVRAPGARSSTSSRPGRIWKRLPRRWRAGVHMSGPTLSAAGRGAARAGRRAGRRRTICSEGWASARGSATSGDAGLYLAEELVAWNRFLGPREKQSLALGVLAMMLAVRSGSTRLPLDPKGVGAELVGGVIKAAGLTDVTPREVMKDLRGLASGFHGVAGPPRGGSQASPLVVDDDALYPHRLWWLESRLAEKLRGRLGRAVVSEQVARDAIAATRDGQLSDEQAAAAAGGAGERAGGDHGWPGDGEDGDVGGDRGGPAGSG